MTKGQLGQKPPAATWLNTVLVTGGAFVLVLGIVMVIGVFASGGKATPTAWLIPGVGLVMVVIGYLQRIAAK